MKTVLISGSTGLIGKKLTAWCQKQNTTIHHLSRHPEKINLNKGDKAFFWYPSEGIIDNACIEGVEAIIHLSGATVIKPWTTSYKKEIIDSRISGTTLLYGLLKKNKNTVKSFVSASGISIYPPSYTKEYDETERYIAGNFLSEVVCGWEYAADAISELEIAVSKLRIGLVLSDKGGVLPKISTPAKYGLAAVMGNGKQWQSWIHIDDLVRMFLFLAERQMSGTYNATAPNPVNNEMLVKAVAKELKKPLWLPNIPSWVLKAMLGERSELVLSSQKVIPKKIANAGFQFQYTTIEGALKQLLKTQIGSQKNHKP